MATGTASGFFDKIIAFLKGSPLFAILSGLLALAFIMPARKRKYRRKTTARRKKARRSSRRRSPGSRTKSPRKTRKKGGARKLLRVDGSLVTIPARKIKKRSSAARTMPARFKDAKKGTPLMAEKMNWLRSKR